MKLKLDDDGNVVVTDGKPVYVHDDGKEVSFDAPGTLETIKRLNSEAKGHRVEKEAAQADLKKFEGIDDPAAAIDAMGKIKSLGDKDLIDAGEVERVKSEAIKAVEEKYAPLVEENATLKTSLYDERVGGQFARSKFIADKCTLPADIMQSRFGVNFKDEDGKAVAYDNSGNKIYSRENPGETAGFDEAMEIIVGSYAHKDQLLKGTGGGSGAEHSSGGGSGGDKTITRAELAKLTPAEQMAKVTTEGFKATD